MRYSQQFFAFVLSLSFIAMAIGQEAATTDAEAAAAADAAEQTELAIGDAAPDFKLKTIGDKTVVLSERFGEEGGPVILLFSRANW